MEMLKINRYDSINADKIESILRYATKPVIRIAQFAKEQGVCNQLNRNMQSILAITLAVSDSSVGPDGFV